MAFRWSILFIAASLSLTFQPVKAQQLEWPIKPGVFRLKGISMERLQRDRAIWVYLPPNYGSDEKQTFDLLLMQDGQNLFADSSALASEKLLLHLAAAKEDNGSVVQEMVRLEGALRASDTNAQGAFVHWIHEKGAHNERYWSSHFSETWLLLQQFNLDQPKKQRFQTFECHSPKGKWWGAYSGLWPETYTICKD